MTENELIGKFRNCVGTLLSQDRSECLLEMINNIDSIDEISNLMDALTFIILCFSFYI